MKLSDFVENTLTEILKGIRAAQIAELGGLVAPEQIGGHEYPSGRGVSSSGRLISTAVEFDIAVTAESEDSAAGGLKAGISVFSAKLDGKQTSKDAKISRIKFSVPLLMPKNKNETPYHQA